MTKLYSVLIIAFLLAVVGWTPVPEERELSKADFEAFFDHQEPITMNEVLAQFGHPTKYGPLLIGQTEEDATLEHSWWYYTLSEEEMIGVQMDHESAQGVFLFYTDPGRTMEIIRADPTISRD